MTFIENLYLKCTSIYKSLLLLGHLALPLAKSRVLMTIFIWIAALYLKVLQCLHVLFIFPTRNTFRSDRVLYPGWLEGGVVGGGVDVYIPLQMVGVDNTFLIPRFGFLFDGMIILWFFVPSTHLTLRQRLLFFLEETSINS